MIKPEQRTEVVKVYVTWTEKKNLIFQARRRGVSVSSLMKVGIFEYLSPREVLKNKGIVRIDRTPKGSKDPVRKNYFRECIDELKTVLEKRKK